MVLAEMNMLSENVAIVPTESVTAIVSPTALLNARIIEASMPDKAEGMVTRMVVSVGVAPVSYTHLTLPTSG